MARILVVDYSRSGNTHKVAQAIAQAFDADLERISEVKPRRGLWGWVRSGREAVRAIPAAIRPSKANPTKYDLVVLGSPVWVGHVSSPMRAYLQRWAGKLSRVAVFVTEGGNGGPKALAEMASLVGHVPAATLELRAKEIDYKLASKLDAFLEGIRKEAASTSAANSPA